MKFAVILEIYIIEAIVNTNDSPKDWEMGPDSMIVVAGLSEKDYR